MVVYLARGVIMERREIGVILDILETQDLLE
jgi:hypothetical protein